MDAGKRSRLEASGYKIGTFRDLLGMSDEEAKLVRLRIRLCARDPFSSEGKRDDSN